MKFLSPILLSSVLLFPASLLASTMSLQGDQSVVSFVSIKNNVVGETHTFGNLSGEIKDNTATLTIKPESVKTKIDIRDQRMKEHLFKVAEHQDISVSADVSSVLTDLKDNEVKQATIPATLNLVGTEKEVQLEVMVVKQANGSIMVNSTKPVLISADDYGLGAGIDMLAKLAGGIAIVKAVPVNFSLVFK